MKPILQRFISVFLSLTLILQLLPVQAFGADLISYEDDSLTLTENSVIESTATVQILEEIEAKRSIDTKHFLNEDGSYTAVKYSHPVHFKTSANSPWYDIDNTLTLKPFSGDVDLMSPDGSNSSEYLPAASPLHVGFAPNTGGIYFARIESQGHTLSWRYIADKANATKASVTTLNAVPAQKIDKPTVLRTQNEEHMSVGKATDGLIYSNFAPYADLEYVLDSYALKENIILTDARASNEYHIIYDTGSLTGHQITPQEIALKNSAGDVIFRISAPYMADAAAAYSNAVTLQIVSQRSGQMDVLLQADSKWLQAKERVYPVTIDPFISESIQQNAYDATAIYNSNAAGYPTGSLVVGNDFSSEDSNYSTGYGKAKFYLKFDLPSLSSGDMVTGGYVYLFPTVTDYSPGSPEYNKMQINAYAVKENWCASTIKNSRNFTNQPELYDSVVDYQIAAENTNIAFDISETVKEWYDGTPNYGICVKANDDEDWALATYVAADGVSANSDLRPRLVITYLNNRGLEGRWTTHTQSLGESGTGYVNDYTGNLVFSVPLMSTTGNCMPVSLSLIYNGYQVGQDVDRPTTAGKGWRLNIQEKITPIVDGSSTLHSKLYDSGYRFIYEDSDGTSHYFRRDEDNSSQYVDEEGLGLTLTSQAVNENLEKYVLTADTGGKETFMSSGHLRRVYDDNGNFYQIYYTSDLEISQIVDGAGRPITVSRDDNGRITSIKDPAQRTVTLEYRTWGGLSEVIYPDGTSVYFLYTDSTQLSLVRARDQRKLRYTYGNTTDASTESRVTKIEEFSSQATTSCEQQYLGNSLTIDYSGLNQTRFTYNVNHADDEKLTEIYQFDNYGRTVSIRDASGNAAKYTYHDGGSSTSKKNNALTSTGVSTSFISNLLRNHSFETSGSAWDTANATYATDQKYLGQKSLKLSGAGGIASQLYSAPSGQYYTFSAYVRTDTATTGAKLSVFFYDQDGTYLSKTESAPVDSVTSWRRIHLTFSRPENAASFRVRCITSGEGNAWFDCVQLENSYTMNTYNMVENGSFGVTGSSAWDATDTSPSAGDGIYSNGAYGMHYYLRGSGSRNKRITQRIEIGRPAAKTFFSVSGQAYGNSVPLDEDGTRRFAIGVRTYFTDGSMKDDYVSFNANYSKNWQYTSGIIGYSGTYASKTVDYIYVRCVYFKNANFVNFDCIQVTLDETGVAYTYDDDGNLISAKDNAGRNQTFTYNGNNDVTGVTTADSKAYEYEYAPSNKHRLLSATSTSSGLKFSYTYDDFGNVISTTAQNGDSGAYIKQETRYDAKGNYVTQTVSDRGYATAYTYEENTGNLLSVTDPDNRRTSYAYDEGANTGNTGLLTVVADTSKLNNATIDINNLPASYVKYDYEARRLKTIKTPSTDYTFTYDGFGNTLSVKADSATLVTNEYADNNGLLQKSTYGNGDSLTYIYDSLDRVSGKSYTEGKVYRWYYNASGQVGRHYDPYLDRTYDYTYDDTGRLLRVDATNGSWLSSSYNNIDLTTGLLYHYADTTREVDYTYDEDDNLPESTSFMGGYGEVTNSYDGLTRRTGQKYLVNNTDDTLLRTYYKYIDWTGSNTTRTTTTLRGIDYTYQTGGLSIADLYYTYDESGNILTERTWITNDNTPIREQYTYDEKNQLTQHDSVTQGKSWEYEYDAAGNIDKKIVYEYVNGVRGDKLDTIDYEYTSTWWSDLLKTYDGKTIIYDNSGNMKSYDGNTYSWTGRRMTSANIGGVACSYTYDADGIRTTKTVNGVKTEYFLNGSTILAQKTGDEVLWFFYDASGTRIGFVRNDVVYYYLYNVQGDVVAIARAYNGQIVAKYSYDAWGNCTVTNASGTNIGNINPFRYRGYYYDSETGFYYLNSRYYSPEFGRFISPDTAAVVTASPDSANYDKNLYAYCDNNPVCRKDDGGEWWSIAIGAATGFGVELAKQLISAQGSISDVNWKAVALATAGGAISGAVGASAARIAKNCGKLMKPAIKAIGSGIGNVMDGLVTGNISSWSDAAESFSKGTLVGGVSEAASAVSRGASRLHFENLPKAQRKSILTNTVFKNGDYYEHWTWNTYKTSDAYKAYSNRFSTGISSVISTVGKWFGW